MDKKTVIQFLAFPPESQTELYNEGRKLYSHSPNRNTSIERELNREVFTKDRLGTLVYELAKAYGISQKEILVYKAENTKIAERSLLEQLLDEENLPVLYAFKIQKEYPLLAQLAPWPDNITELLQEFAENANKAGEKFEKVADEAEGLILSETLQKRIDEINLPEELKNTLDEFYKKGIISDTGNANKIDVYDEHVVGYVQPVPEDISPLAQEDLAKPSETEGTTDVQQPAETFSLRGQYPFLNEKDCPDELKILVADKIAAYNRYAEAHAKLQDHAAGKLTLSDAEITQLAGEASAEFEINQDIARELDYYKEHKTVLGEHPLFAELAMERKVAAMTNEQAHKIISSAPPYISRKKAAINKAQSEELRAKLSAELSEREKMVLLAKKKLNLV